MNKTILVRGLGMAVVLALLCAPAARAQSARVELGTTLTSLAVGFNNGNTTTWFSIPSPISGFFNPGVYVSLFLSPRIAVEPQLNVNIVSVSGHTMHSLGFSGQVDYFVNGTRRSSPYLFGEVGVIAAGMSVTPASLGGGLGYRVALGDRLAIRLDGRFTHLTDNIGNAVSFSVSLGGLFGRR